MCRPMRPKSPVSVASSNEVLRTNNARAIAAAASSSTCATKVLETAESAEATETAEATEGMASLRGEHDVNSPDVDREPKQRPTKWGRCSKCNLAMTPHVYKSGKKRGQCWMLCSGFWKFTQSGARRCFNDRKLTRYEEIYLPDHFKRQVRGIEAALGRGAKNK